MSDGEATGDVPELPKGSKGSGTARFALNAVSGALPLVGGLLSAGASAWSEREQARINDFLKHLAVAAEMKEKTQTILELTARIDMQDEKTAERIRSEEYQSLLRKAFRDWAGTESEEKRILVRNLLSNAACNGSRITRSCTSPSSEPSTTMPALLAAACGRSSAEIRCARIHQTPTCSASCSGI